MSLQERYTHSLESQIADLTKDCYYLISLLNQTEEIDWENWPQGQKIKEHLNRSKVIFDAIELRKKRFVDLDHFRDANRQNNRSLTSRVVKEDSIKKSNAIQTNYIPRKEYTIADGLTDIFNALDTFRF